MNPTIKMYNSFAEEGTLFYKMMTFTRKCLENVALKALISAGLNKAYET